MSRLFTFLLVSWNKRFTVILLPLFKNLREERSAVIGTIRW